MSSLIFKRMKNGILKETSHINDVKSDINEYVEKYIKRKGSMNWM